MLYCPPLEVLEESTHLRRLTSHNLKNLQPYLRKQKVSSHLHHRLVVVLPVANLSLLPMLLLVL